MSTTDRNTKINTDRQKYIIYDSAITPTSFAVKIILVLV